jgi:hypothetical protein
MSLKRYLTFGISAFLSLLVVVPLMGSSCDDNVDCVLSSGQVVKVSSSAQCAVLQQQDLLFIQQQQQQLNRRPSLSSSGP